MKKVTLEDIAKECGVTKGAVSRALAGKYNVSKEMTYMIKKKALEMGYNFNKLKVSKKVNRKVLILCPSRLFFKENFWITIIKSSADKLSESGINTEYFIYDENNIEDSLANLNKGHYCAYIVIHYNVRALMDALSKQCIPTVVVDPKFYGGDATYIKFSNFDSSYKATQYLIDKGHRRIVFYGSNEHSTSFKERFNGYISAVNSYENIEHYEIIFDNSNKYYADNEKFKKALQDFKPTAVVCANDLIAINAYRVIKALGLKIPDNISVVGFDNVQDAENINPKLTTFNIPLKEIGEETADYLINIIEKNKISFSEVVVRCAMIERESVK